MVERQILEDWAAIILEPVRDDLSDSEYRLISDDIIAIYENLDRRTCGPRPMRISTGLRSSRSATPVLWACTRTTGCKLMGSFEPRATAPSISVSGPPGSHRTGLSHAAIWRAAHRETHSFDHDGEANAIASVMHAL
jgi:hypothetical protein